MIEAFGASDPGCVRQNNEDSLLVAPDVGLYVVADGMGGAQAGEFASSLAVKTVLREIVDTPSDSLTPEVLAAAVQKANMEVFEAASIDSDRRGMGTTMVAVAERGGELMIASVGDSRAYSFANGTLAPITEDQSWVNEGGRRIGLDDETLRTHRMRNVLTMAIGVSPQLRINSYSVRPPVGTEILISSDGLHGVLTDAQIQEILASGGSLEERCQKLIALTRELGAPDNVTVIMLRIV